MIMATDALKGPADHVARTAARFVVELQRGFLADRPTSVGAMAQLRRDVGKVPQDIAALWGVTGLEKLFEADTLFTTERQQERAETAYLLAVTLYALHQQSQGSPMHKPGVDLGQAVRQLMPPGEIDETIRRRFVRLGTAATPEILAYRLREVISLLRGEGVPLDYGRLARQLYKAQTPDGLSDVRREWGRSFHTYKNDAGDDATTDKDTA